MTTQQPKRKLTAILSADVKEGIVLVTGPTGSGKTTTLYSVLNHVNTESVNIMTLEDPVEYPLAMIRQTSVNESAKLDFANGIRSMMRQDPDIILVGEIRDHPTAEMAFRAAMTGHQVYSTLHTNSAIGAIPRLLDIGILPDIMAGNIIGIVAQRLVRILCNECKYPYQPDTLERKLLGVAANQDTTLYRAAGLDTHHAKQAHDPFAIDRCSISLEHRRQAPTPEYWFRHVQFVETAPWFPPLNIRYAVGVGIAFVMVARFPPMSKLRSSVR